MMALPTTLQGFCWRILACGDLQTKLASAPSGLADAPGNQPIRVMLPARTSRLALREGAPSLPRLAALVEPAARAQCLARFAHHELMAVELFAWAVLRFPAVPGSLRRGWLAVLAEEQTHCHLYLERLAALGADFDAYPVSDYFWRQLPALDAAPAGPRGFLCAMGLTLEQANLDFTLVYRDGFRAAGDEDSARVCERVHEDEIGHVRFARSWLLRLAPGARDDADAYEQAVPFPLSAARAKARRFDVASRRRAGFSEAFVERVRSARSSQETRSRGPEPPEADS
ncbi:MAG: DUF455 family protein [Myxococcales bacterium]|nr:DUF455 family protein [Myxococcales bacterium]